jgi:hypothetical protein
VGLDVLLDVFVLLGWVGIVGSVMVCVVHSNEWVGLVDVAIVFGSSKHGNALGLWDVG